LLAENYEAARTHAQALIDDGKPLYQRLARATLALAELTCGNPEAALAHTDSVQTICVGHSVTDRTLLFTARARALQALGRFQEANQLCAEIALFLRAATSGLPASAREDYLERVWVNRQALDLARDLDEAAAV
jgi:hypothetical protein